MKHEDSPPSWILRTHFSRSVCYRSSICSDASLFSIPREPLCEVADASTFDNTSERDIAFIAPALSFDVFCGSFVESRDTGNVETSQTVYMENENEPGESLFSFPSSGATCSDGVCRSPSSCESSAPDSRLSSPSRDDRNGISSLNSTHRFRTIAGDNPSITPPRRSSSFNNILRKHGGIQGCTSSASSPSGGCTSKLSMRDSLRASPVGTLNCSPTSSHDTLLTYNNNSAHPHMNCLDLAKKSSSGSQVKRDMARALSWSDHLASGTGNERAVLSSEIWMIDLSQLLLGERFATGMHSRIYHGMYQNMSIAVKIIHQPDENQSLAGRLEKAFMQEVNTLSSLQHPNIVKFIAACKKPPVLCVITEYLSGGSLRAFLHKREGKLLPIPHVLRLALDITYAMEYLHAKGIVHRDLKSENLVLGENDCIKVLDFGVSCFESDCNSDVHDLGTYRWMAPEMLSQKPYTRKVDVYSFGIVLWELLTTRLPYEEMGAVQAAYCVIHKVKLLTLNKDLQNSFLIST
ncbi:hypothetical protein KP509_11G013700 [Ceratopteris richardii]|uniref:non-specific serine/threonine protein kinase n=1 Tax=Ceratopteris richardii TaxID=49495 RepID=A0A8T2TVM9_CERRI|nr:hypothetical protein KP509_11G013700 [Ceratopteris richardii]